MQVVTTALTDLTTCNDITHVPISNHSHVLHVPLADVIA